MCDDERFGFYFNRRLRAAQWQYNQYLRLESVEFDPMVGSYLERLIDTVSSTKGTQSQKDTGKEVASGSQSGNNTVNVTSSGNSSTEESGSNNQTVETTDKETMEQTNTQDNQQLTGATPDSSVYPAAGFPEALQWQYASGQSEAKGTGSVNSETNREGSSKSNGGNSSNSETNTSGTEKTVGESSAESESTVNRENSSETNDERNSDTQVKERATGRSEAPQDMLQRARDYILGTNAFMWLLKQLDITFYGIIS